MPTRYGNAADFETYWEERGMELPAADAADIESALLVASEWIDGTFGALFIGYKTGGYLQEREWPRYGAFTNTIPSYVFANNEIPGEMDKATYEAAYRQLVSPGSLLVDYTPGKYKRVSIDGAVSVDYAQFSSSAEIQKTFPAIERLLAVLLAGWADGSASSYSSGTSRV